MVRRSNSSHLGDRPARQQAKNALTKAELAILRDYCEILDGSKVRITKQLDTATYERMRVVFERLGGVYVPGRRCFAYECNPTPLLERTIALEQLPEKNPLDFYWSPPPVAASLIRELEFGNTMEDLLRQYEQHGRPIRMIEISAGLGHLADAFRARYPMVTIDVCELDEFRRAVLESKGYNVVAGDAFDYHPSSPDRFYDIALLNPPFTIGGDAFTFITFIMHAYGMLFDNEWSKLVSVVPSQLSHVKRYREFYIRVLQCGSIENLPEGSFAESGTKWDTSIISLHKRLNYFYATWDEPDEEDGFLNKRVREAWRYISIDKQLGNAEQSIIDDMLESRLGVYSNGQTAQQTKERILAFCQLVTERLLCEYQAYIPLNPADREGMERHILFDYQLQRSQYADTKRRAWERTREMQRDTLQATIKETQRTIQSAHKQCALREQALERHRRALEELEKEQVPRFEPAELLPPPEDQPPACPQAEFPVAEQPSLEEDTKAPPGTGDKHPQRTRYVQYAFF